MTDWQDLIRKGTAAAPPTRCHRGMRGHMPNDTDLPPNVSLSTLRSCRRARLPSI